MLKKIISAALAVLLLAGLSACSIKDDTSDKTRFSVSTTVLRETRIHNYFKDMLPDFEFENQVSESYEESVKYIFNVECSERECKKYIEALKEAGFVNSATETESYYTASTDEGYFVEMTHINGMLTVYTKKI